MESTTVIIDFTFLKTFTNGDPQKIKHYIGLYLKTAPVLMEGIKAASDNMNYIELFNKSHALKPLTTYVGIAGLGETLAELELAAREDSGEARIKELVEKADQLNSLGVAELEKYVNVVKSF